MATGTAASIIGRERELHLIETMLAYSEPSTSAVLLEGDAGDDTIDGGSGTDTIYGGAGNDTINAKDRQRDTVYWGAGDYDAVVYDAGLDEIDIGSCERR